MLNIITRGLFASLWLLMLPTGFAAEPEVNADPASSGDRYRITTVQQAVILLNTETGETWMLRYANGEKELPEWFPLIQKKLGAQKLGAQKLGAQKKRPEKREAEAELELPIGDVKLEYIPELDLIILKGSRKQVAATQRVIRSVGDSDRSKTDGKPFAESGKADIGSELQPDRD